jgi:ubiquinone/menaquinone biosynthesis C-methylase UbiE
MTQLVFDEDTARSLDAVYQIRDARRRRQLVRDALGAAAGERILDVGCGPGFYCQEIAAEVGPSGVVVGVDSSGPMLALAERRCNEKANVDLRVADVASLPVHDGEMDAALCVQVLEYVREPTRALSGIRRALRPGGRIVVWDVDWATLTIHTPDPARTARILRAWDHHLAHRSLPRTLASRLRTAGFAGVAAHGHSFCTAAFDPQTYGGGVLPQIAAFAVGRGSTLMGAGGPITEEESTSWLAELRALDARGEFFFAITQFCFTAVNPG